MEWVRSYHREEPLADVPLRKPAHIPALDGLRGAAALLVVISHFQTLGLSEGYVPQSGTFGVMIFFVLSGFLMGHLYLFRPFDMAAVIHFMASRIARVIPLFYAVILASYIASQTVGPDFVYYLTTFDTVKHLLFLGSKYVFWSIPPEVEFYVVFVGLWYVVARRLVLRYLPLFGFGLAAMFVLQPMFPGITVFNSLPIFLVGVGAAVLCRYVQFDRIDKRSATIVQCLGIVLMLSIFAGIVSTDPSKTGFGWERGRVYENLPMALLFGAFVLSFTIDTTFARFFFANRVMRLLGAYSFSIYLLHEPVADTVRNVLAGFDMPIVLEIFLVLSAIVVAASLSFRLYEMPMQAAVKRVILRLDRVRGRHAEAWRASRAVTR
ncbi:acyltransferase [Sphingomonas sp. T9W2]|uniref:acyltransferase family protein n=1 Tax=Sphingomonas sp. T9W2 TaxID=3143183 RepID=UPI0031F4D038